jgi:uncharacterized linocin/CFP29 family protein
MFDFLWREDAPLSGEQWAQLDATVIQVARHSLVGRRFIPIYGPVGAGLQQVSDDVFTGTNLGVVNLLGDEESDQIRPSRREWISLPIIHKDFTLHWRDLETSRQFRLPLETSSAAAAAAFCARAEDDLIFFGSPDLGLPGLLTADGRQVLSLSDWTQMGAAFADVVRATQELTDAGFFGAYALVVSPRLYTNLNRLFENAGVLELEQVQKLVTDGVFRSPVLPDGVAVVVATGEENMDLAVGQDMITAYLGPEKMNHEFRVFETLAPRIKRPEAICTLESAAHREEIAGRTARHRLAEPASADRRERSQAGSPRRQSAG